MFKAAQLMSSTTFLTALLLLLCCFCNCVEIVNSEVLFNSFHSYSCQCPIPSCPVPPPLAPSKYKYDLSNEILYALEDQEAAKVSEAKVGG